MVVINRKPKTSILTISPYDLKMHATNVVYVVFTPSGLKNKLEKKNMCIIAGSLAHGDKLLDDVQ